MSIPPYIKAMHPKTEIMPSPAAIAKILNAGWAGQMKIHGHRAQVHLNADKSIPAIVYNRQGQEHKMLLPDEINKELRRIFDLIADWTVIDAEWLKPEGQLFLFDLLKLNGKFLRPLNYADRYALIPKSYISPFIKTLPLLTSSEKCLEVLGRDEEFIEGLVFKSLTTKGFSDSAIVRCRKLK